MFFSIAQLHGASGFNCLHVNYAQLEDEHSELSEGYAGTAVLYSACTGNQFRADGPSVIISAYVRITLDYSLYTSRGNLCCPLFKIVAAF